MKKKPPTVVRTYSPDEEAKVAALKLLIERTVPRATPCKRTAPDERPTTGR